MTPIRRNTACQRCKQRKLKCDAARPACGNCQASYLRAIRMSGVSRLGDGPNCVYINTESRNRDAVGSPSRSSNSSRLRGQERAIALFTGENIDDSFFDETQGGCDQQPDRSSPPGRDATEVLTLINGSYPIHLSALQNLREPLESLAQQRMASSKAHSSLSSANVPNQSPTVLDPVFGHQIEQSQDSEALYAALFSPIPPIWEELPLSAYSGLQEPAELLPLGGFLEPVITYPEPLSLQTVSLIHLDTHMTRELV
jgi:hypothetical protein